MTQQPFSAAALRGAVDLSSLGKGGPSGGPQGASGAGAAGGQEPPTSGLLVHATDQNFTSVLNGTATVPAVLVLWADQMPESRGYVDTLVSLARSYEGRFRVVAVDLAASPGITQALTPVLQQTFGQISALPVVMGLLSGQPMPFFLGAQPEEQVRQLLDKFLEAAVANGVTGRADLHVQGEEPGAPEQEEPEVPPLHQRAYDAIDAGDLDGAAAAFDQALAENPADEEARLGRAQVELLRRTQALDPQAVREAAAERPDDVDAQARAADLDLVGGHVEDAFTRLLDLVRRTAGEDRDRVRQHLLGLFDVIGQHDERVVRARRALMSALF